MSKAWPLVKLGEVLEKSQNWVNLDAQEEYKEVTVRLWGKGVTLRGMVTGSQIAGSRRLQVNSNQFILSRIDARNGAFGLIPDELNNAVVSNDFPVFDIHQNRLLPKYLYWLSKTKKFVESCKSVSEGSTNRVRLKEDKFTQIEIPLPPLTEQQRIIAKIERLAGKIDEARALRNQVSREIEVALLTSARIIFSNIGEPQTRLADWLDTYREGIQTGPFGAQLGREDFCHNGIPLLTIGNIQFNGLLTNHLTYISKDKAAQLNRYQIKSGDILFARMGTVGRCCIVPKEAEGWLINYHIIRLALNQELVNPKFIHWTIRASKDVEDYLSETIRGATRAGVNSTIVSHLPCRIPILEKQNKIVKYLDELQIKIDCLKATQSKAAAELDALLPSILDKAFKGEL